MAVRPIVRSDHDALNRLHREVGWPERSPAGWRWLESSPAREDLDAPAGWVVTDDDDRPAAMLGNFVQRFQHGSRSLYGATGFSIIVPPSQKGASRPLIRAFLKQPGLFARYTFNANARSAPLYGLFGLKPWPEQTHALKLSWTTDRLACAEGRVLRTPAGPHLSRNRDPAGRTADEPPGVRPPRSGPAGGRRGAARSVRRLGLWRLLVPTGQGGSAAGGSQSRDLALASVRPGT